MSSSLTIEIVSDFVCPWCYVGKKRLEKALAQFPDVDAAIRWLPFQLSPDMPREGKLRREHYEQIFGARRGEQIMASMRDTGIEEGIEFGSQPDAMSPNTLAAHTLLHWASEDDQVDADALAEALFRAHHVDCVDLGDPDVLVALAAAAGMHADTVREKLAARADEDVVQASMRESAQRGVSGVPFYVVNQRYGISGAQPADALADMFRQILAEGAAA